MHVLSTLLVLFAMATSHAQEAASVNAEPSSLASHMALNPNVQNPELGVGSTEVYSETGYRPDYDSLTTDTRLRYEKPILLENLKAYIGASIERDLQEKATLKFIANAVSPQVGVRFQPLSFLNIWAEYRHRYQESLIANQPSGESDPRAGLAIGYFGGQGPGHLEAYGEAVWIPRLSGGGVFSAYARPFWRQNLNPWFDMDLYGEIYGYSSPTADMGPSRTQARAGGRLHLHSTSWQSSLLVYRPWNLGGSNEYPSLVEALLVIGGTF